MSSQNFFGSYAAIRFATGKKAPGILFPLLKATALILYVVMALPFKLAQFLAGQVRVITPPDPAPVQLRRPTTHRGMPFRFQDHIDELTKEML